MPRPHLLHLLTTDTLMWSRPGRYSSGMAIRYGRDGECRVKAKASRYWSSIITGQRLRQNLRGAWPWVLSLFWWNGADMATTSACLARGYQEGNPLALGELALAQTVFKLVVFPVIGVPLLAATLPINSYKLLMQTLSFGLMLVSASNLSVLLGHGPLFGPDYVAAAALIYLTALILAVAWSVGVGIIKRRNETHGIHKAVEPPPAA
jgi:hypothetical protein